VIWSQLLHEAVNSELYPRGLWLHEPTVLTFGGRAVFGHLIAADGGSDMMYLRCG
jgi:hypothetical protein